MIIVNYNAGPLLSDCVAAVLASGCAVEVIVSDNGSADGSPELLRERFGAEPRFRLVENRANLGFAAGNNAVLHLASAPFILFLNPDCIVEPSTLPRMVAPLEARPSAGMAGPLILNRDGSEQRGCRRTEPTPWRSLARVLHLERLFPGDPRFRSMNLTGTPLPDGPVPVEAISGAFMLVRRAAMEQVGPLDDGYFMHCEDLDWCRRFREAGHEVLFVPGVAVLHEQGTCSVSRPVFVEWHKSRGMLRYFRKFYGTSGYLLRAGVTAAVWGRFGLVALKVYLSGRGR